jgi:Ca2+/Na+ antiporter
MFILTFTLTFIVWPSIDDQLSVMLSAALMILLHSLFTFYTFYNAEQCLLKPPEEEIHSSQSGE